MTGRDSSVSLHERKSSEKFNNQKRSDIVNPTDLLQVRSANNRRDVNHIVIVAIGPSLTVPATVRKGRDDRANHEPAGIPCMPKVCLDNGAGL